MRVNVGLDTSSAEAAPRPSAIPLVSVVFPAPRSPDKSTTPLWGSMSASFRPSARVSSSECVSNRRTELIHGLEQKLQHVGREHGFLAPLLSGKLAATAVQPHRPDHRSLPVV